MNKIYLAVIILGSLLFSLPCTAQYNTNIDLGKIFDEFNSNKWNRIKDFDGEFYLEKEWNKGQVHLKNMEQSNTFPVRYFVYGDEMQIIHKNDTLSLKGKLVDSIRYGQFSFIYAFYVEGSKVKQGYMQALNNEELKLLKRYTCKLVRASKNVNSYQKSVPDHYEIKKSYFVQKNENIAFPIKINKKEILKQFKDKEKEIMAFIKSKKIKLKREKDLIQLFKYYNQLN